MGYILRARRPVTPKRGVIRLARNDGRGIPLEPALTVAAIRAPDGWSGALLFDLAAALRQPDF
jgi:hypothetical protein